MTGKKQVVKDTVGNAFFEAYSALNPAQKQAVDAIEGPVMVIAGPGTGKTQILALRIANILEKTDTAPSSILALTFTEAGVASMRARLARLMGARGYQVRIHTFHGFCNTIIKRYPEHFPRIIGSEQILEIDALKIIEGIIDAGTFDVLRPVNYPYYYVRDIKSTISEVKRENISADVLRVRIDDAEKSILAEPELYHQKGAHAGKMKGMYVDALKKLAKAKEFEVVYRAYEAMLASTHQYDFEDTILEVVHALTADEELKLMLQEEHQYVLADEHQDANGAQNQLLELLSDFHDAPNLFVVGDEKQAIYRFQGASLANFLFFKERYPDAVCIELTSNYRSTQVVLDAAHDVIAPTAGHESIPRPRLAAKAGHPHTAVSVRVSPDESTELAHLVSDIRALIQSGSEAKEIVVLARRNADVATVARALKRGGVEVSSLNDEQVLGVPLVRSFIQLVRAVANFGEEYALYPVLYAPFLRLPNVDIYRLTEKRAGHATLYDTLASRTILSDSGVSDVAACMDVFVLLNECATFAKDAPLRDIVDFIFERAGIAPYLMSKTEMHAQLESFRVFLRYVTHIASLHPHYGLRDLLVSLDTAETYGVSLLSSSDTGGSAVRVATVHKSKGLEYDHVFVPFAHDARWGSVSSRAKISLPLMSAKGTDSEVLDDERRLLYVAMTRARKSLSFSFAQVGDDGREQIPSRFLADIAPEHTETVEREQVSAVLQASEFAGAPRMLESLLEKEREHIRMRLATQGMSVSALNNYLTSPWRYFFQNLLRIPARKEPHQIFGTAMDSALKLLTRMEAEGACDEGRVLAEFERILTGAQLPPRDYEAFRARGVKALSGYIVEYGYTTLSGPKRVDAGIAWSVLFQTQFDQVPELPLRGEYDKVEFLEGDLVRVIDFKTGSPKSRNVIEGKTKGSEGNYKRQLVFYALLATLDPVRAWKVEEGVIDFVEPDEKGRFHREAFLIEQSEIQELEDVLRRSLTEIANFSFFDAPCTEEEWSKEGVALVEAYKSRFS